MGTVPIFVAGGHENGTVPFGRTIDTKARTVPRARRLACMMFSPRRLKVDYISCCGAGNRSRGGRGLVHFSANPRCFQVRRRPKTWTCPPLPRYGVFPYRAAWKGPEDGLSWDREFGKPCDFVFKNLRVFWLSSIGIIPLPALWLASHSFAFLIGVQILSGAIWSAYDLRQPAGNRLPKVLNRCRERPPWRSGFSVTHGTPRRRSNFPPAPFAVPDLGV